MLTFKTAGSGVTGISGLAAIFLPILVTLGSIASPKETSPRNKIYRQLQTNMVNNSFGCLPCGPILDSSRFRIIGGRKATHHRPWMVFIELNPAGNAKFHCGGSIINKRFILTAAHCACDQFPCTRDPVTQGLVADLNPLGRIVVYVGILDTEQRKSEPSLIYQGKHGPKVKKLMIHPKYQEDVHDIALLEVTRDIVFIKDRVSPICLPFGQYFPDRNENGELKDGGIVAGWGWVKNALCHTNLYGPSPYMQCRFPFEWNGKVYNNCSKDVTPAAMNEKCVLYNKTMPQVLAKSEAIVYVNDTSESSSTTCYTLNPGLNGWCMTCNLSVTDPNDPAFCNEDKNLEDQQHLGMPASDNLWGLCQDTCGGAAEKFSHDLQEVRLTVFGPSNCSDMFTKTGTRYSEQYEICAGWKNYVSLMKSTLDRRRNGAYRVIDTGISKMVVVGGQDSCFGDSGGPLWREVGHVRPVAFQIGLVSRGLNCANFNSPGIYTRIKSYLKWILKKAKSGRCRS